MGERVRLAREKAIPPITQKDLAARLQTQGMRIERVTISKIESGHRGVTDVEIVAIAKSLGVEVRWLFGEGS